MLAKSIRVYNWEKLVCLFSMDNHNHRRRNELIISHVNGDWGDLEDEDKKENELSVKEGFRILSAYHLDTGAKVWVITEWDRSVTTILLPEEY